MIASTFRRGLHATALLRQAGQEGAKTTQVSAEAVAAAEALRRVLQRGQKGEKQGDDNRRRGGGNNRNNNQGQQQRRREGQMQGQGQRQGQGQGQGQRPQRRPSALRDHAFNRGASTPANRRPPLPPIKALIPPTEWSPRPQNPYITFSRVPYTTPSELLGGRPDLDALVASPASSSTLTASPVAEDGKKRAARPLRQAERSFRYHLSTNGRQNALGHFGYQTPISRPGPHSARATSSAVVSQSPSEQEQTQSIKEQSREERMRLLDETIGGDYTSQLAPSLLAKAEKENQQRPQVQKAAEALASNAELNVASRAWTLDVVQRILKRVGGNK